jgi:hypothetical protein
MKSRGKDVATPGAAESARLRRRDLVESAKNAGMLAGENGRIGGRIRQDDFGVDLLKLKGSVSRHLDLEF